MHSNNREAGYGHQLTIRRTGSRLYPIVILSLSSRYRLAIVSSTYINILKEEGILAYRQASQARIAYISDASQNQRSAERRERQVHASGE
ncbi:MAG: hypothetical protein MJZ13_09640 [Bacteroidales bacterium]|nr:hypothetical protein [Bacteroidales bacterium]